MKVLSDIFYGNEKIPEKTLDAYIPDGDCRAVFLYIHGGGIEHGDKSEHSREGKFLTDRGYAFLSINYHLYPNTEFPAFINDAAEAARWAKDNMRELFSNCGNLYIGGSSAGGYISMMLCFDKRYLGAVGMSNADVCGYLHDAGQPTSHFNVLKYSGKDSRRVIVDETAPIYFVGLEPKYPTMRFIVSDNDMFARYEQTMLMVKTMEHFGYKHFDYRLMHGKHCEYTGILIDGETKLSYMILDFLENSRCI